MRKFITVTIVSLGLTFSAMPAWADYGTPDPGNHLSPAELPRCYDTGLTLGIDNVCTSYVTCAQGDGTCNSFCSVDNPSVSVECAYVDDPGVRTWSNILYRIIDHYRAQGSDLAAQVRQQARRIARLRAEVRHLHRKVRRLKTRLRHDR